MPYQLNSSDSVLSVFSLSLSLSLQVSSLSCSLVSITLRTMYDKVSLTFSVVSVKTPLTSSSTPPLLERLEDQRRRQTLMPSQVSGLDCYYN